MVLIYALMSGEEVLYVGQTINTLQKRAHEHRCVNNNAGSKNIPPDVTWEIKLLEECEEEHATSWERFYIEMLTPPYNKVVPGRTKKEYQAQSEVAKEARRVYRQSESGKAGKRDRARKYYLKKKAEREATRL